MIKEILFKGGKAKTGQPKWDLLIAIIFAPIFTLLTIYVIHTTIRKKLGFSPFNLSTEDYEKTIDNYHSRILEIIQIASDCADKNLNENEFKKEIENFLEGVSFRKQGLIEIAKKHFESCVNECKK